MYKDTGYKIDTLLDLVGLKSLAGNSDSQVVIITKNHRYDDRKV